MKKEKEKDLTFVFTRPSVISAPGVRIRAELAKLNLTQDAFANRMSRPPKTVNLLCQSKVNLTPSTALDLEKALGIPAEEWLAAEAVFRLFEARKARGIEPEASGSITYH